MAKGRPAILTVALSAAAVLGYLSYRALTRVSAPPPPAAAAGQADRAGAGDAASPKLVEQLPDFALPNLAGDAQSIRSWPGKPLVINFWATWCGPCLREIPMLKSFQDRHASDIQVVGVAVDKRDAVVGFAAKTQFNYPVLIGENDAWAAAAKFGVNLYALPFTVFTAADGSVLGIHTGELLPEHLDSLTATLTDLSDGKIKVAEARERLAGRM